MVPLAMRCKCGAASKPEARCIFCEVSETFFFVYYHFVWRLVLGGGVLGGFGLCVMLFLYICI